MKKNLKISTLCVQAGWEPKNGEPVLPPIVQSTTFKYDNTEEMAMLFDLKKEGYFYTRLQNPTNDAVAKKIATLEGGVAATLTSSGQAANFYAVFNICEAGDHIVTSNEIYGGTYNLFGVTLKKLGIECTFVDQTASEDEIQKAFRPNTKLLFGETISNPGCNVLDIEKELKTVETNGMGFTRMVDTAFNWFAAHTTTTENKDTYRIACITSIAGTKGLGAAPAYSATKRFQNHYLECLAQQARMRQLPISITDLRPGFVATDLIAGSKYPLQLRAEEVARHIVHAIEKGKEVKVIDWRYAILVFFWRHIPRWLWTRLKISQ